MDNIVYLCLTYWQSKGAVFSNAGSASSVTLNNENYLWFSTNPYRLNHKIKYKSIDAFPEISKLSRHKVFWQEKCKEDLYTLLDLDDKSLYQIKVNEQDMKRHVRDVKNFLENYNILKISSPMATRKSNIIEETIKQCHENNKRVLIITNRISLANDIEDKYKNYNIKHYQKRNYDIGDSLVVQFDSLYHFNPEDFDVVILDEVTSLLLYMTSTYNGKEETYVQNLNTFSSLSSKQFLISDSFMIHFPFETDSTKTLGIYNEFREELSVCEYENKKNFEAKIIREARKGLISVSSNEKRFLVDMQKKLEKRHMKVLLLTGDTINKEEIYNIFQNKEINYDAILYSPTLTVGVSIFCNIKQHFHFDNSGTITVIDSLQMTRRVRNAKFLNYHIRGRSSYKETDINNIEKRLYQFKIRNKFGETFGLTNAGKLLADITRINNIFTNTHKYAFRELLLYQFKKVINKYSF